jgi:hypothetical protein
MKKIGWIQLFLWLFLFGCTSKKEETIELASEVDFHTCSKVSEIELPTYLLQRN